jgi:flagellar basal body-associated protein FliL
MEKIWAFIMMHQIETLLLGFGVIVLAFVITHWQEVKFWWLNFSYNFPVFGKISRLAKDIEGFDENHKWFYSEERLCRDYYNFYEKVDVDDESYDEAKDYLHAVGELGRKPTPTFIWIMIFVLVIVEALGFAYVLAGFTIPGASEATQQKGAVGVAAMLAILLVWLTHLTGQELHKNTLIKKIRRWYKNDNAGGHNWRDLKPDEALITIDNTFEDKESPNYIRMLNRLDVNDKVQATYTKTILTLAFIIAVAVGATYIRHQVLVQEIASSHESAMNIFNDDASPFGDTDAGDDADIGALFTDAGADDAKEDLSALFGGDADAKSDTKSAANGASIEDETNQKGGDATFMILGLLFVFIQILGIFFGMHYDFAGRESKEAYECLRGFSTKKAFLSYYERAKTHIARIAQRQLQKLQHKMNIINDNSGTDAETTALLRNNKDRTFKKYLEFEDK